jgi:hypothetical protein
VRGTARGEWLNHLRLRKQCRWTAWNLEMDQTD